MRNFGLVGRNIEYSFSRKFFAEKFLAENIVDTNYVNFDLPNIEALPGLLADTSNLKGFNVTIPYKESIIPFLDSISDPAREIGAVNTVKIEDDGRLIGFNTDEYGFRKSIEPLLQPHHKKALILGTGGASKAVAFALSKLGISHVFVSREKADATLAYQDLHNVFCDYQIVINTTPLGTHPNTADCPNIPYEMFSETHLAYDLIYNPSQTTFLQKAAAGGATVKNGLEMLELQAIKAWEIWND